MAAADLKMRLGRFAGAFKSDPKDGRHVAELLDLCRRMSFDTLKELRDDVEFIGTFDTFYTVLTNYVSQKMAGGGASHHSPMSDQVTRAVLLCCSFKRYTETLSQSAATTVANMLRPPPLPVANMPFLTTMAWNQWLLGGTDLPEKPCYYELPLDFKISSK